VTAEIAVASERRAKERTLTILKDDGWYQEKRRRREGGEKGAEETWIE